MIESPSHPTARRRPLDTLGPALVVGLVLFAIGLLGVLHPLSLTAVVLAGAAALVLALMNMPILVLWLVPLSMAAFIYLPVMHYEILVLLLAGGLLLQAARQPVRLRLALQPIEWRYGLFLLALLPSVVNATNLWRFGGMVKIYVMGLIGFEVSRRAAARFGREALIWGPLLFVALTSAMLTLRIGQSGVPSFRSLELRTYLTQLPWGSSNYVAAVIVLCMPAMVYVIRVASGWRRGAAVGVLTWSLATMLLTVSRGGFVLSVAYLGPLLLRSRRSLWIAIGVAAAAVAVLALTPPGRAIAERFTNASSTESILWRMLIWKLAWARGLRHLPLGIGAGQGLGDRGDLLGPADPHNFLLTLFSEDGVLGVLTWLSVFAALWHTQRRLCSSPESMHVGGAMRATLVLVFINMLFEPTMTGNLYHMLFWWLMGIYYGMGYPAEIGSAPRPVAPPPAPCPTT